MEKTLGMPLPLGVTKLQDRVNFSVAVCEDRKCELLLYHAGEQEPCEVFSMEEMTGDVRYLALAGLNASQYEYNYKIDEEVVIDPYARSLTGHVSWKEERDIQKHEVRARVCQEDYDWEGDGPLKIPYHQVIAYALHVRGFTKDAGSKVKHKGTFQGVIEKIPYLKELGINQIQCMPVYEFQESGHYTNYWGYGNAYFFAPKSAYDAYGVGVRGLKDMVKACHKAGVEVVLEMPFVSETPKQMIEECLRYYVLEYHVDGFVLNPYIAPMDGIYSDPLLRHTKIMKHREDFQRVMRRFLKGDEGMIQDVIYWLRNNSKGEGIYNYVTGHTGFTLKDLVSYDGKHNETNGENNHDGPEYNYSWNCGAEGTSRKKAVLELRKKQMRNAYFLVLLAQGTPCILAGDEFANSQKGNNNAYCQDNPTGWVNWRNLAKEQELFQFVKDLIRLRKSYPVFYPETEVRGMDRTGCGVPDVSYHGEDAWQAPIEVSSRQIGVYYSAAAVGGEDCFVAYNMHWLEHTFALPSLSKNKKWHLIASTGEGIVKVPLALENQRKIELEARTVVVLAGR